LFFGVPNVVRFSAGPCT